MKVTFKDLKQQKFTVEVEPSDKISAVKEKIAAEKGWEASGLKLIYSGKILQDDNTVESYKVEEKGFIVCMTSKPKPAPKASAAAVPSTPAPVAQVPSTPAAPAAVPSSGNADPPATPSPAQGNTATTSTSQTFNDPSALTTGEDRAAAIANMEAMGFTRTDIDRAMRAAFFNPDRAVEYLLNGIPASAQQQEQNVPAAAQTGNAPSANTTQPATQTGGDEPVNLFEAAAAAGRGDTARSGTGGGQTGAAQTANLDFLRASPQFQQLRTVVQQQPQMLEPILQQVAQGNPQLAQLIQQNPEDFMRLLAEDADGEEGDVQLPPGLQQIAVTEEERDAIERLCRLGFERDLVVQAYFACDKNEELAANFLFDQPDEQDDAAPQ